MILPLFLTFLFERYTMFLRSTMLGLHYKRRDLMDGSEGAGAFCDFMEHCFGNGGMRWTLDLASYHRDFFPSRFLFFDRYKRYSCRRRTFTSDSGALRGVARQ